MILFYVLALIPIAIGAFLWVTKKEVVWYEWAISSGIALLTALLMNYIAIVGMTGDTETWSGHMSFATFYPEWVEEYQEAVYKTETYTETEGFGKDRHTVTRTRRVFSHYETRHRTHPEHWDAHVTFGTKNENYPITKDVYNDIKKNWGGESCVKKQLGERDGFDSGDRYDYVLSNKTNYVYPAVMEVSFENRVKAAPTTFSYIKVPDTVKVFDYPKVGHWRASNRVLGTAKGSISVLEWDRLNDRLGAAKKVNLIIVGFGSEDASIAQMQEAKWIGGKKNDLVLCYGGTSKDPTWSYVFGWTEQEIVKRNLETLLLKGNIDNSILAKIETEVVANYTIKDWKKFDYISIEPPLWSYIVMIIVLAITQTICYVVALNNDNDKDSGSNSRISRSIDRIRYSTGRRFL